MKIQGDTGTDRSKTGKHRHPDKYTKYKKILQNKIKQTKQRKTSGTGCRRQEDRVKQG